MDGSSVNETSEGGTAAMGPPPTSSVCEETSRPVAAMPRFASERVECGAILRSNGRMRCPVADPSNCDKSRDPFAGHSEESAAVASSRPTSGALSTVTHFVAFHLPRAGRWRPFHDAINGRRQNDSVD